MAYCLYGGKSSKSVRGGACLQCRADKAENDRIEREAARSAIRREVSKASSAK